MDEQIIKHISDRNYVDYNEELTSNIDKIVVQKMQDKIPEIIATFNDEVMTNEAD